LLCEIAERYTAEEFSRLNHAQELYKNLLNEGYFSKLQVDFSEDLSLKHNFGMSEVELDQEKIRSRFRMDQAMEKYMTLEPISIKDTLESELDSFAEFQTEDGGKKSHIGHLNTAQSTTHFNTGLTREENTGPGTATRNKRTSIKLEELESEPVGRF
jgi:hypothetical protein